MRKTIFLIFLCLLKVNNFFSSPSLYSTTGLILMPSAKQLSLGGYSISFSRLSDRDTSEHCDVVSGSFGLQDEIEIGVASIDYKEKEKLIFAGKYQITKETGVNPAVGIGMIHIPRNSYLIGGKSKVDRSETTYYVVASQNLTFPRELVKKHSLKGHLGYGEKMVMDGIFGGIELVYNRQLTFLCEYDTNNINFGVNIFISPGISIKGAYNKDFWSAGIVVEVKGR